MVTRILGFGGLVILAVLGTGGLVLGAPAGPPEDPHVRAVCDLFFAPCCWRESLAVHMSPEAEKMRAEVAVLLRAGYTEQAVVDHYVAIHGERVLRMPRGQKALWLTVTPLLVLGAGVWALAMWMRRYRRQPAAATASGPAVDIPDADLED